MPPPAEDSSNSSLSPPAKFFLQSFDSPTTQTPPPIHGPQSSSKHPSAGAPSFRCMSYIHIPPLENAAYRDKASVQPSRSSPSPPVNPAPAKSLPMAECSDPSPPPSSQEDLQPSSRKDLKYSCRK